MFAIEAGRLFQQQIRLVFQLLGALVERRESPSLGW